MSDNPTTAVEGEVSPVETEKPLESSPKLYDEVYVKELRQEAAAARVAKKDAVDAAVKAANDAHQAELAARDTANTELQNKVAAVELELEKYRLAVEANVPSDKVAAFVNILQGSDSESLAASAQSALELAGGFSTKSPAFDPTQGLGGRKNDMPLNGDPILDAIKSIVGA